MTTMRTEIVRGPVFHKASEAWTPGTAVTVGRAYVGGGRYAADGTEGRWFIVRGIRARQDGSGDVGDYALSREPDGDWQVIVSTARMRRAR